MSARRKHIAWGIVGLAFLLPSLGFSQQCSSGGGKGGMMSKGMGGGPGMGGQGFGGGGPGMGGQTFGGPGMGGQTFGGPGMGGQTFGGPGMGGKSFGQVQQGGSFTSSSGGPMTSSMPQRPMTSTSNYQGATTFMPTQQDYARQTMQNHQLQMSIQQSLNQQQTQLRHQGAMISQQIALKNLQTLAKTQKDEVLQSAVANHPNMLVRTVAQQELARREQMGMMAQAPTP